MFKQIVDQVKSIELNRFDKIAISLYIFVILGYIIAGALTILTVGGLILIGGAFYTYKGKILTSVAWYIMADFCWIANAIDIGDMQGAIFVTVGVIFGTIATFKMKNGHMDSELKHKEKE
jgi:uncharacterized membrane protein YvlD (DUF360 family)